MQDRLFRLPRTYLLLKIGLMEASLLKDIDIVFFLSIVVLLLCFRIHIPSIVGFIITGVLSGPHGFGLIRNVENVQQLADVGIILLLFTIGMELSFKKIQEYWRFFLNGGIIQVSLVTIVGIMIGKILHRPWGESVFLGFLLALSSTAIVLPILEQTNQLKAAHGKLTLGILIFQDVIAVPMMLLVPLLAGKDAAVTPNFLFVIGKAALILSVVTVLSLKVVPLLLFHIAKTKSKELFLLSVATICFTIAWVTSAVGLSLSLGAFLAGLVIAESEYNHEAIGDILPFKEIFTSFFFLSVGMLLDVRFLITAPLTILFLSIGILIMKALAAGISALSIRMSMRTAVMTGLALCQVGEFSFVLAKTGFDQGLGSDYRYQLFLSVSLLTMAVAPTLLYWAPAIANHVSGFVGVIPWMANAHKELLEEHEHSGHILIVGFGLCGKHLAKAARESEIPYMILDLNPEKVQEGKKLGEPIFFGDAVNTAVLRHMNIEKASVMAIVVSDFFSTLRIIKIAKKLNPSLHIIVRTNYMQEAPLLLQVGANEVVTSELGTSMEIFTRVLLKYEIEADKIGEMIQELHAQGHEVLHLFHAERFAKQKIDLKDLDVQIIELIPGSSLTGKTLGESDLRKKYGISVLLIKRKNQTINAPSSDTTLELGDQIVVSCTKKQLDEASAHFNVKKIT